ncbi:hypothetical protein Tco_1083434 [Tanacetum coccineum]
MTAATDSRAGARRASGGDSGEGDWTEGAIYDVGGKSHKHEVPFLNNLAAMSSHENTRSSLAWGNDSRSLLKCAALPQKCVVLGLVLSLMEEDKVLDVNKEIGMDCDIGSAVDAEENGKQDDNISPRLKEVNKASTSKPSLSMMDLEDESDEDEVFMPDDEMYNYMSSFGGCQHLEDDLYFYDRYEAQVYDLSRCMHFVMNMISVLILVTTMEKHHTSVPSTSLGDQGEESEDEVEDIDDDTFRYMSLNNRASWGQMMHVFARMKSLMYMMDTRIMFLISLMSWRRFLILMISVSEAEIGRSARLYIMFLVGS